MIVLDTHILVWWVSNPENLSERAKTLIEKESKLGNILVSSISIWEIYMLVKKKRLKLSMDVDAWIGKIESLPFLQFIPVDNAIAAKSVMLPEPLHKDPADRIIIATARVHGANLVTSDRRILSYPHMQAVW